MAPLVFMTLAQPWSNNHYANLILFLSASIYVVGAAPYFIIVFGATMASTAPTVFLSLARNFISDIGARRARFLLKTLAQPETDLT